MNNGQESYSKDRSGSRAVSPKVYRERRKRRQGGGDRKGKKAGRKGLGWGNYAVREQQRRLKQLDLISNKYWVVGYGGSGGGLDTSRTPSATYPHSAGNRTPDNHSRGMVEVDTP